MALWDWLMDHTEAADVDKAINRRSWLKWFWIAAILVAISQRVYEFTPCLGLLCPITLQHRHAVFDVYWSSDWWWGLPLLVFTVVFHARVFVLIVKALVLKVRPGKGVRKRLVLQMLIAAHEVGRLQFFGANATLADTNVGTAVT